MRITHGNLHANISAMAEAARLDVDRDVQVSWLPLFHDMGMVGFLTVPMTLGLDLVTVTPLDFLGRPILWAELISKYGGTVTAAPNFAYAVLGRQLARYDGELDLSSLRIALNGAEPIDPVAVGALVDAGARFGLRPEAVLCAYGMAETALGVAFAPVETGLKIDEIDAEDLETRRLATPGTGRSFPKLGPPLPGIEVRVVADGGAVLGEREVGVLQLRGPSVTAGLPHRARAGRHAGCRGLVRHRRRGLPRRRAGRRVRQAQGRDHHGRPQHLPDRHRTRRGHGRGRARGQRGGGAARRGGGAAPGVVRGGRRVPAGERPGGGGRHRQGRDEPGVSAVGVRPARVVVLAPGSLPKTPSGKLRRAATAELLRG